MTSGTSVAEERAALYRERVLDAAAAATDGP